MALITRQDLESDYFTPGQIASEFGCDITTARRWIEKYFDKSTVEISGGRYYVRKDEVERWRLRYGDSKPVRGRRLRDLEK